MVENVIIVIIVACCAFYIIRKFYKQAKGGKSSCGCSCTGCDDDSNNLKTIQTRPARKKKNGCNC